MSELHYLSLVEVGRLIGTREVSSVEVTKHQLDRIAQLDPDLASFTRPTPELALAQAERADRALASGDPFGPLHGVPIAVKDLFWTRGVVTAAGTRVFADFVPEEDATCIARLDDAGAVFLGKLTTCEAAYAVHHPDIRVPLNPWNPDLWSGASSSGSGVATAAGLCFGSLGTDTSGSIRLPAAVNGVVGLKPTWGRVSRYGLFDAAPTLDHAGPLARSVADIAVMLQVIAGADEKDPTASQTPVSAYPVAAPGRLSLRIGVDPTLLDVCDAVTAQALRQTAEILADAGATIIVVDMPRTTELVGTVLALAGPELAEVHASTFAARRSDYGEAITGFIEGGASVTPEAKAAALVARAEITLRMTQLFGQIDVLLLPTTTRASLDRRQMLAIGDDMDALDAITRFTCPFNLTGFPALTMPVGVDPLTNSPISAQLAAAPFQERFLLQAGLSLEAATPWHRRHPDFSHAVGQGK